jgi:putative serine protease PepD
VVERAGQSPDSGSAPLWWSDAVNDPWRDPYSEPVLVSRTPPTPPPPAPEVEPGPLAPRLSVGLIFTLVLATALLAGALGGAIGYAAANKHHGSTVVLGSAPRSPAAAGVRPPDSLAGVAAQVEPSVVTVHATGDQEESVGSGFVIASDGYILTNDHVVATVENSTITVTFSDNSSTSATLTGRDPESDLAVLKVARTGLPAVELGDSDQVAVGDAVFAVGSPFALAGTVTSGIVSALDRTIATGGEGGSGPRYYAAIQTDAAVNPGNSGGPLCDMNGQVIGINSVINAVGGGSQEPTNIGIAFAIPIDQARRVASEIIDTGRARRTVIGAQFDASLGASQGGARVRGVDAGGPAAHAGLRTGDLIVRMGTHPIEQPNDLIALVRRFDPGTTVTIVFRRGGSIDNAQVTLAADGN